MAKAKKGDYIRIIKRLGSGHLEEGKVYRVDDRLNPNFMIVAGRGWSCTNDNNYEIVYRFNDYLKQIEQLVNE